MDTTAGLEKLVVVLFAPDPVSLARRQRFGVIISGRHARGVQPKVKNANIQ